MNIILNIYYKMPTGWMWGLKKFNEHNDGAWCIPKRGSKEYYEVYRLMGLKPADGKTTKNKEEKEEKSCSSCSKPKAPRRQAPSLIKRLETKEEKAEIAKIEYPETKNKKNYIELINKKYKTTNLKNLQELRDYIIKNFINTEFIKYYRFSLTKLRHVTKRSQKNNPHGADGVKNYQKLRKSQGEAQSIYKKYNPVFEKMITNPVVVEVLSNYIIYESDPDYLIDLIDGSSQFKASFTLTYKITSIDTTYGKNIIFDTVKNSL